MNKKTQIKSSLRSQIRWGIVGIFVLLVISSFYDAPVFFNKQIDWINNKVSFGLPHIPESSFSLGLDLQGGAHLIYQADVSKIAETERGDSVDGVRDVIERRVNGLGVGETNIQTARVGEDYRIIVELPGVTDVNQAIKMIGETPILEFKEINNEPPRELTVEEKTQMDQYNKEAEKKTKDVLKEITGGLDFSEAAKKYSEQEASKNNGGYLGFVGADKGAVYDWAKAVKEGEVSKTLVNSAEGYNILKRGGEREGNSEVRASHILICYLGAKGCDNAVYNKEESLAKAQELYNQANATNFVALAKENSSDPGSATKGGDLGFFVKEQMVKPFSDAVFGAKAGQILGPVESEFGYHVIYKTDERKQTEYELFAILIRKKVETDILPPQEQFKYTGLSGSQLEKAEVVSDPQTGSVQVSLQFDSEGKELFKQITERNVGKPVAIYLDGMPITVPTVQQAITDGRAVITGNFDLAEAKQLSQRLNTGALPVPINLISQQTIGASLGAESLVKSVKAGVIALLLVMLFIIGYYSTF